MQPRPLSGAIRLSTLLLISLCASITAALVTQRDSWTEITPDSRPIKLRDGRLLRCWWTGCAEECVELCIEDPTTSKRVWISDHCCGPVRFKFTCDDTILLFKAGPAPTQAFDVRGGKPVSPPEAPVHAVGTHP